MTQRLTKRDWEILSAVMGFVTAGENPFDEPESEDPITDEELEDVWSKVAQRCIKQSETK